MPVCPVVSDSWDPVDCSSLGSSLCRIFTQKCWSELPFPAPKYLADPGIKPMSLGSLALAGGFFTTVPPGKPNLDGDPVTVKTEVEGGGEAGNI